jgi:profilin
MAENVWQQYIDDSLIGSGNMHSATILSKADGSYWAYGGEHVPQPDEAAHIVKACADADLARSSGVRIGTNKYFVVRVDENGGIIGKLGAGGCYIAAAGQCIVVGVYGEGTNPAHCNESVITIIKYLKENGY